MLILKLPVLWVYTWVALGRVLSLRVQVPNSHILTQNLYYNYYYPDPKYLIIGYMDLLGYGVFLLKAVSVSTGVVYQPWAQNYLARSVHVAIWQILGP